MAKALRTLFIGNGVNRLAPNGVSWKDLVSEMANQAGAASALRLLDDKPFTLVYEEIRAAYVKKCHGDGNKISPERRLKGMVAEAIGRLTPNDYHRKITKLNFDHIITPNYDYTLEESIEGAGNTGDISGRKQETKHSIHRFRSAGGKKIWHIHGEVDHPWSICLGFDHYAGYLHKMREMIVTIKEDQKKDDRGHIPQFLVDYWHSGIIDAWYQLFFTGPVDIVGFGMDYTEIDLWWLIGHRARKMAAPNKQPFRVGEITFHQFVPEKGLSDEEEGRLSILESLDVIVKRTNYKTDHKDAWDKWFTEMQASAVRANTKP